MNKTSKRDAALIINKWLVESGERPIVLRGHGYVYFASELVRRFPPDVAVAPFATRADAVTYIRGFAKGLKGRVQFQPSKKAKYRKQIAAREPRPSRKGSFYRTAEWKRLRYQVLVERGARCECCGVSSKDGARINVDHIKPVSRAWHLRLDKTNLQVLCGACNQGKGATDQTDWRSETVPSDVLSMFDMDASHRIH